MKSWLIALCALLLAAVTVPAAAQQVTIERDTPLYAEPRLDATQVTQLRQGADAEVVGKKGAWLNLKTAGGTGWLFSFNVRYQNQGGAGDSGTGSAASRIFGQRRSVNVTSTIGIRGLDEEDLKQATFNAEQMKQLDGYVATKQAAERAAKASGLAAESVEYMGAR